MSKCWNLLHKPHSKLHGIQSPPFFAVCKYCMGACLVFNSTKDTWHCHSHIHPHSMLLLLTAGSWLAGWLDGNGKITSNGPLPSTSMRPCNTASTNSAVIESVAVCIKTCNGKRSPPTSLVSTGMTCVHAMGKLTNTCTLSSCWVGMSEGKWRGSISLRLTGGTPLISPSMGWWPGMRSCKLIDVSSSDSRIFYYQWFNDDWEKPHCDSSSLSLPCLPCPESDISKRMGGPGIEALIKGTEAASFQHKRASVVRW